MWPHLLPGQPRRSIFEAQVWPRTAEQACREAGAATERCSERSAVSIGPHFEVLSLSLAQAVLHDLREPSATELQGDKGDGVRLSFAHSARGRRRLDRDRTLAEE